MKKIIGFDIDGVITDESHPNDNIWHDALCKYLGRDLERVHQSYPFTKAYGLSIDVVESFMEEKMEELIREVKPMEGALYTLDFLDKKNFHIHLITARNAKYDRVTYEWLNEYSIPYTSLIHDDNKAPLAVEKGIELFIEDSSSNTVELIAEGIPVILLNKYHNQDIADSNLIFRVDNWSEINRQIINHFSIYY